MFTGRGNGLRTPQRWFHRRQLRIHRLLAADIFQLRFQLAICRLAQVFELFGFEFAHLARFKIENQGSVAYAANLFNVMSDLLEHLAQFTVATLDDDDFIPGIVALADLANLRRSGMHTTRARFAAFDGDADREAVQLFFGGLAADLDQVGLFHARGGFGEFVGQIAVVGHQQQAFAQVVEPSDGVEALAHLREELHHGRPASRDR